MICLCNQVQNANTSIYGVSKPFYTALLLYVSLIELLEAFEEQKQSNWKNQSKYFAHRQYTTHAATKTTLVR